ncbi:hypothetical protein AS188_11490 [Kocuria flava]|uniref:Membrane protein n=1 Tax=Kocuria flava TaxID=446860 RepID=A0A0U2YXQ2_9MICC|nr:DUF2975 domain-containing protein [Kocuria flava]ALU40273.1 hypothetical protein AS188_11490 [Kocuria flava]GEO92431.1 membrane protein [Kocuria flava]
MTTERWAVAALRVFLVLLFGILLVFQFMSVPGQFAHMAEESPGSAHLRWPLTVLFGFWILCVQVVVVATWKLLTLVREDRIFSDAALVWVDAIVAAVGAAWAVLLGVSVLVGLGADDPGPVLVVVLATTGVTVLGLLMVVMRALLRRATALRTDMEAVI